MVCHVIMLVSVITCWSCDSVVPLYQHAVKEKPSYLFLNYFRLTEISPSMHPASISTLRYWIRHKSRLQIDIFTYVPCSLAFLLQRYHNSCNTHAHIRVSKEYLLIYTCIWELYFLHANTFNICFVKIQVPPVRNYISH